MKIHSMGFTKVNSERVIAEEIISVLAWLPCKLFPSTRTILKIGR
jgi:hypothetical protein